MLLVLAAAAEPVRVPASPLALVTVETPRQEDERTKSSKTSILPKAEGLIVVAQSSSAAKKEKAQSVLSGITASWLRKSQYEKLN